MGSASKELLKLELNNASSSLESSLLVCPNGSVSEKKNCHPHEKPIIAPIPKSQVIGKVRDFLGVISEANEKLRLDTKENSRNFDIEALTGNESQIIKMDLMLGIADHTPEAVAAAESVVTGCQPVIPLSVSSSGAESEDSSGAESEDSSDDDDDSDYDESDNSEKQDNKTCPPMKLKRLNSVNHNYVNEDVRDNKSKKRSKIVEL